MSANKIPTILIVEPDESLITVLSYNLERCGFIVNTAKNANTALHSAERVGPDLIIMEEELTGSLSGSEVCSVFKTKASTKNVPVILMAQNLAKAEKLKQSNSNIISFLVKPFAPSELISIIKKIYTQSQLQPNNQLLEYKNLTMNVGSYRVTRDGKAIHLGPTEFKILQCLMQLPSRVLSREDIMSHVWGYNSQIEPRTIDVHINRLRSALKNDNVMAFDATPSIKTVRSAGYCLN